MSIVKTEYWSAACDGCGAAFTHALPTRAETVNALMEHEWRLTTTHNGLVVVMACPKCQKIVDALTVKEPAP